MFFFQEKSGLPLKLLKKRQKKIIEESPMGTRSIALRKNKIKTRLETNNKSN